MSNIDFFKKNKYVVIRNFLQPEMTNLFYAYCKIKVHAIDFKKNSSDKEKYAYDWDGGWGDHQSGDFNSYGDMLMDTLLLQSTDKIKKYTDIDVFPQYSYFRLYEKGSVLAKHKDRDSCEISSSICLGQNSSNLDYDYNWPFFINDEPINLNVGDMVIYRGCELEHHRNELLGLNQAQVFLHYHDKNGPYYNGFYDNRTNLGTSKFADFPKTKLYYAN